MLHLTHNDLLKAPVKELFFFFFLSYVIKMTKINGPYLTKSEGGNILFHI